MTQEEKDDLLKFYCDAVHQHTVLSKLSSVLSNAEWDKFTERAAQKAMELVEGLVDEEFARLERASIEREELNDLEAA